MAELIHQKPYRSFDRDITYEIKHHAHKNAASTAKKIKRQCNFSAQPLHVFIYYESMSYQSCAIDLSFKTFTAPTIQE